MNRTYLNNKYYYIAVQLGQNSLNVQQFESTHYLVNKKSYLYILFNIIIIMFKKKHDIIANIPNSFKMTFSLGANFWKSTT